MNVHFKDISLSYRSKNSSDDIILDGISGVIPPGKMTCILGPSGCGKTTLLNVLALRLSPNSGEVYLKNGNLHTSYNRKKIAYVIQDDILLCNICPQEYLAIYCKLQGFNKSYTYSVTEHYLELFNLSVCKHIYTQQLSGGQRKRLAIALELIRNPSVIYLDEPTSGLDSPNALQCIRIGKRLAKRGKTVCCTMHQPSSNILAYFDDIIVISNKKIIFHGTLSYILDFLKSVNLKCPKFYNPADYFLELATGDHCGVEKLIQLWEDYQHNDNKQVNHENKESGENISSSPFNQLPKHSIFKPEMSSIDTCLLLENIEPINPKCNTFQRMYILFKREFLCMFRDWFLLTTKVFSNILIGLIICAIYFKIGIDAKNVFDNLGCLFFSMIFIMFISLMPTVLTFPLEKVCVVREHKNHWYSLCSYYLSKTLAELPFNILNPIIFATIIYFSSYQPKEFNRYAKFTLTLIQLSQISQSLGLLIGTVAPSSSVAVFVAPIVGIPLLLFCGYFITVSSINKYIRWLCYITFGKYGWENIVLSIYGDNRSFNQCNGIRINNATSHIVTPFQPQLNQTQPCFFHSGEDVLKFFNINENIFEIINFRFFFNFIILLNFYLVIRNLTYLCLKLVVRKTVI